ncbi:hypothetical protein IMZ48_30290 [Candidatus Bathyarchaeota archaeon]|nr:hypothetical protein [Candidatus Bathyarchaeota archaeon]
MREDTWLFSVETRENPIRRHAMAHDVMFDSPFTVKVMGCKLAKRGETSWKRRGARAR